MMVDAVEQFTARPVVNLSPSGIDGGHVYAAMSSRLNLVSWG